MDQYAVGQNFFVNQKEIRQLLIDFRGADYGYEQYGALNGFFNATSLKEDNFVYMPGWRRRQIGSGYNQDLRRDFFIFAIMLDGTTFAIGAKSIKMGCTQ